MIVPLLLAISLILCAAKLGGWLSNRLGQPAILGELIVGLLLGPSVAGLFGLEYFQHAHVTDTLYELGELGVIFLMFAAGLDIHLEDFLKMGRPAVTTGVLGVLVPCALGAAVVLAFGFDANQSIFLGIVLSATSVSISAQTLMEMGVLRSKEGLTLLGAAVIDDLLAIALLSTFVAVVVSESTNLLSLAVIVVRMLLFLGGAIALGTWLLPKVIGWARKLTASEPVMTFVIVAVLLFAWAAEFLGGVAAITGAFIVGVALSRSSAKADIQRGIHTINYAFFVPIFLVGIGLTANVQQLSAGYVVVTLVVCLIAIVSKLIGAGLGARLGGMSWIESARLGIGMISRGEVGLIVANVGVASSIIGSDAFTLVVVMVLVTTLVTPPLLRLAFRGGVSVHA